MGFAKGKGRRNIVPTTFIRLMDTSKGCAFVARYSFRVSETSKPPTPQVTGVDTQPMPDSRFNILNNVLCLVLVPEAATATRLYWEVYRNDEFIWDGWYDIVVGQEFSEAQSPLPPVFGNIKLDAYLWVNSGYVDFLWVSLRNCMGSGGTEEKVLEIIHKGTICVSQEWARILFGPPAEPPITRWRLKTYNDQIEIGEYTTKGELAEWLYLQALGGRISAYSWTLRSGYFTVFNEDAQIWLID